MAFLFSFKLSRKTISALLVFLTMSHTPARSQNRLDSLLDLLNTIRDKKTKIKTLNEIATEYTKTDPSKGVQYAKNALKEADAGNDEKGKADALFNIGLANDYMSNYDTALAYHFMSLKIREKLGDQKAIAQSFNNIGIINHLRGNFDEAIIYYNKTIDVATKSNDKKNAAKALNNIGSIYEKKGDFNKATEVYIRALGFNNETGDKHQAALTTLNLGLIEYHRNNYKGAVRYYFQAKKMQEDINDKRGLATTLNDLAGVYTKLGKGDSSSYYFNLTYKLFKEINDNYGMAHVLINLGSLAFNKQDYGSAMKYYREALAIREAIGDKQGAAFGYKNIGQTYKKLNRFEESEQYLEKALKIARETNLRVIMKDIYSDLADLYLLKKDYFKAHQNILMYSLMKDTIYNEESSKQMAEMNTRFETEKKDKELIKKDAEITRQTAQTEKQNIQRNAFIVGFLLVALLALYIFKSYRQKHKANEIITRQKEEVEKKNVLIAEQKALVEHQKELVEEKQKEVMDSIHYAHRIQRALLAGKEMLDRELQKDNYFVLFKPKDIVSGDFYWATTVGNMEVGDRNSNTKSNSELTAASEQRTPNSELFYLAICDSTGHGVPGAFMSLLNIGFLSEAIKEKDIAKTSEVFNYVRRRLVNSISREGQQDGFDGILACFDRETGILTYSAANNAPILISGNILTELSCDKMPVGKGERNDAFNTYTVNFKKGDLLYLYTDGYADQFGGPKGKKFKYKQLNDLLMQVADKDMPEQATILENRLTEWKGELEQVDDILLIGLKF